jgi:predicted DNA-binding transcriptional regulator YafY
MSIAHRTVLRSYTDVCECKRFVTGLITWFTSGILLCCKIFTLQQLPGFWGCYNVYIVQFNEKKLNIQCNQKITYAKYSSKKMNNNDTKRLSRLTAILTQLQTKRLITATTLAGKFNVSIRTIYRDIRALEQSGVPILTEDGKGYTLMEGYKIPPVMFTENQANALVLAEQLVLKNKDTSFIKDYTEAIDKIKAVLGYTIKDKANLLAERTRFNQNINNERNSNNLSDLQFALTNFCITKIDYTTETNKVTSRLIEPFALLSTQENWLLVAWCRLRKAFRYFRLDRIKKMEILTEKFTPHKFTLQEYFDKFY